MVEVDRDHGVAAKAPVRRRLCPGSAEIGDRFPAVAPRAERLKIRGIVGAFWGGVSGRPVLTTGTAPLPPAASALTWSISKCSSSKAPHALQHHLCLAATRLRSISGNRRRIGYDEENLLDTGIRGKCQIRGNAYKWQ